MASRKPRSFLVLTLALSLILSSACRVGFYHEVDDTQDAGDSDGGDQDPPMPWGAYAATLDVPPCPDSPYAPLVVNTTADELDGGETIDDPSQAGDNLSFVEAMRIAFNREGPDTILFDQDVFPVDDPATILLSGEYSFQMANPVEVCIDGRNRGVTIAWPMDKQMSCCSANVCGDCIWHLYGGSMQVGLTLLHMPYSLRTRNSQSAGCRFGTDGNDVFPNRNMFTIQAHDGSIVGPGNVIANDSYGVKVKHGSQDTPKVRDNYFGYDPVTKKKLELEIAVYLYSSVTIEGNVFAADWLSFYPFHLVDTNASVTIRNNYFGVDEFSHQLPDSDAGIVFLGWGGSTTVGPGNIVNGVYAAVEVRKGGSVRITRNSIFGNNYGILFTSSDYLPVEPPVISEASDSEVKGTCPVAGTVEIFSDSGNQGETFLGEAACDGATPWSLSVQVPRRRNLTATLTDTNQRTSGFSDPYYVP